MKALNKLLVIPVFVSISMAGLVSATADDFLNDTRHFLDDTHYWDDHMFGDSRVNYSLDNVASQDDDQLPSGIASGDFLQDPRYFLDDTNYWDDQMFGRNATRVNYSISPDDIKGVIYDDVFIEQ